MIIWDIETKGEAVGKPRKLIGKTGLGMKDVCMKKLKILTENRVGENVWVLDEDTEVGRLGLGEKK